MVKHSFPKLLFTAFLFTALLGAACERDGVGGNAEVHFYVKHHEVLIPHAMVYIKYGAKESPGTDLTAYDDSAQADAAGHGHFHELLKGDYYLYGVGYDSAGGYPVTGGIPIKITKGSQELETDVPVTE